MPTSHYRLAGGFIGLAGSLIGAGGAGLLVPFLTKRGLSMAQCSGNSTVVGVPLAVAGHDCLRHCSPARCRVPPCWVTFSCPRSSASVWAALLAAPVGARLSKRVPAIALKRAFSLALLALAIKLTVD